MTDYRAKIAACKTVRELHDYIQGRRRASLTEFPTQSERWSWRARLSELKRAEGKTK